MPNTIKELSVLNIPKSDGTLQEYEIVDSVLRQTVNDNKPNWNAKEIKDSESGEITGYENGYILNKPSIKAGTSTTGKSIVGCDFEGSDATADYSAVFGKNNTVSDTYSFAFGNGNTVSNWGSFAEGYSNNIASSASHAEGTRNAITGSNSQASHVEGRRNTVSGIAVHAEGQNNTVSGNVSHVEGANNTVTGQISHVEGQRNEVSGSASHAEGFYTIARKNAQHVFGRANIPDTNDNDNYGTYIEIVGNGDVSDADNIIRRNARTLDWQGNGWYAGKLTVGSNPTENMDVATKQYVDNHVSDLSGYVATSNLATLVNPLIQAALAEYGDITPAEGQNIPV